MRNQPYCCICGGPFLGPGYGDLPDDHWLYKAVVLTTVHDTADGVELDAYWQPSFGIYPLELGPWPNPPDDAERHVLELEATCDDDTCYIPVYGKNVALLCFYEHKSTASDYNGPGGYVYFGIHRRCHEIANRFIDTRRHPVDKFEIGPEDQICCIKQLWQVYHRRYPGRDDSQYILEEPYDYFGGRFCRHTYWERDDDPGYGTLLEADPMDIPSLTEAILNNLEYEGFKGPTPTPEHTCDRLIQKSSEIQDAELTCEYVYSQDAWCDALVSEIVFPWLWDLDREAVRARQQSGEWNWELLVRKLSQIQIHEPADTTLSLPLGLKNRRRIWRLLQVARVDDVAGPAEALCAAKHGPDG